MSPFVLYPLTGNALVLAVSLWLTLRYRRRFFTYWTLGYAAVQLTLFSDLLTLGNRVPIGTAICALSECLAAFLFSAAACAVGLHKRRHVALVLSLGGGAAFLATALYGISPAKMMIAPSLAISVSEVLLGVALLRSSLTGPHGSVLAIPVLLKGCWILSFPIVTGTRFENMGYTIDGLLLLLTGLGMIVYLLEAHARELGLLLESNRNHAFFMLEADGTIQSWNVGGQRLFGLTEGEVLSKNWRLLDGAPPGAADLNQLLHASQSEAETLRLLRRADGSCFWAQLVVSPIRSAKTREPRAFALLVGDVSPRVRLQEERARLVAAIEQAADAILIADADGQVVYANGAFERRQGGSGTFLGRKLTSLCAADDVSTQLEKAIACQEAWRGASRTPSPGGEPIIEDLDLRPIVSERGAIQNFVLTIRDVTRQVALENQLRNAQKMEEFGRLAGTVAHELGNQLAIIVSSNYSLRELPFPPSKQVESIDRASRRADLLVRKLLLFARRDFSQPRVVDLNAQIEQMTGILPHLLGDRVKVRTDLAPKACLVYMDPGQIEQIVFNLATNARDAMPEGGILSLSTTVDATPDGTSKARWVKLHVEDSGTGMNEEVRRRIFEPFFTTKAVGRGSGLGLSIVQGIVRDIGGRIEVESAPTRGTVFEISLPLHEAQGERPSADCTAGDDKIVMISSETPPLLESLGSLLERAGYETLRARSASEAHVLFAEYGDEVDLLLVDAAHGSDEDAARLAQACKQRAPKLRVILLSGRLPEIPGAADCQIQTPFQEADLVREVDALLRNGGTPESCRVQPRKRPPQRGGQREPKREAL